MQVYSAGEKNAQINRTAQRIKEIGLSRFFFLVLYMGCGKKKHETCRTHAKKYLHSIFSEIHADYVMFFFKKKIFAKRM